MLSLTRLLGGALRNFVYILSLWPSDHSIGNSEYEKPKEKAEGGKRATFSIFHDNLFSPLSCKLNYFRLLQIPTGNGFSVGHVSVPLGNERLCEVIDKNYIPKDLKVSLMEAGMVTQ